MRRIARLAVFSALLWSFSVQSEAADILIVGRDAFAFHEDLLRGNRILIEPSAVEDLEILVEIMGLTNIDKINSLRLQIRRSFGLNNAAALDPKDGFRTIVYDPKWATSVSPEFYLVLGHETGHLVCGHSAKAMNNDWEKELEADRFGGASIKRFEIYHGRSFIREVMAAARNKYPESGSPSHPPRALRIAAIKKGYEEGSPCGDLAPAIRGYTRGSR